MNRHPFSIACTIAIVLALAWSAEAWSAEAGSARVQYRNHCSAATLKGAWGYIETGSVIAPSPTGGTMVVTAAAVGLYEFYLSGNFEGEQDSSQNGAVGHDTKQGTYVINPNCTGTLTLTAFRDGVPQRLSVWAFVIVGEDDRPEMKAMMTSLSLPNGTPLSPIMTMTARPISKERGGERD